MIKAEWTNADALDLQPTCNQLATDVISRQAAIDALKNRWKKTRNYEGIGDDIAEECELYLKQLPSAQPEIVRCKDCKYFAGEGMYCENNIIVHFDHFYCYNAERRTDEND